LVAEGSNDENNVIFLPYSVALKLKPNAEDVFILAVAKPGYLRAAIDQVTETLRVRRQVPLDKPNNFGISTADSIIDTFRSITFGVAVAMIAISSVGLMVGGIGVMNMMLVSVTERTREIGIRKAIRWTTAGYYVAVPDRSDDPDWDGWDHGLDPWLACNPDHQAHRAIICTTLGSGRRASVKCWYWAHLRAVASVEGVEP
jgi:hypothetical protein